jgi:SAM-dependent methyltransferase
MSDASSDEQAIGAFDTNAAALARRIEAHARFGTCDFDSWALERFELAPGQRVLELGCGTGKQTLPVAEAVGASGHVVAVDASRDALTALSAAAKERSLTERITLRAARFDDLAPLQETFDRVISCYALYYALQPEPLLAAIEAALANGGVLFFCGPSQRNNAELRRFCAELPDRPDDVGEGTDRAIEFIERTGVNLARSMFSDVEECEFENPLRFDSPDALLTYWTSYNLYDPALEARFRAAAERHFANEPLFETVKRVRGVRARKRWH